MEAHALTAWRSDDPYQRVAALHALHRIGSSHLDACLASAALDDSHIVRENAAQLMRAGQ